jgi:PTH1 family peptidyl-tRNA hydrolase
MSWFRRGEAVSTLDLLVAGLGNPGREYSGNRHNIGFMVADELARRHDGRFRDKFSGRLAELRLEGKRAALLKPETYMNESGRSIGAALRFFKLAPAKLIVVHDEVDLEPGRLQLRLGGGLAGHNGLRSIAQALGTKDFLRLRVGVGRPGRGDRRSVADFVLSDFESEVDLGEIVARAADAVELLAGEGPEAAQARFNER